MALIPPLSSSGGVHPTPQFQTEKIQGIINHYYKSVPSNIQAGCNLVIMQSGIEPVCLHAGNVPLNAPQHWGSVSKQFTTACITKLVDQKKIKWTDDIRQYLPELPEFKLGSQTQRVTIDDLAYMRSGISEVGILAAFSGLDDNTLSMTERLKLHAQCSELLFMPGSQKMYCNDNYCFLAEIVERVAKKPFIDFVREEIFSPLEMEGRCSIDPSCPKTVNGYNSNYQLDTFTGSLLGAVGIVGPPTDMAKWNSSLATHEWDALKEPPPNVQVEQGQSVYCRGLKVAYIGDYRVVYHTGSINGFCARFMRYEHLTDASKNFAFFLASNTNNMPLVLNAAEEVADSLAGKNVRIVKDELSELSPPRISIKTSMSTANPYKGEYECPASGLRYRIDVKNENGVPTLYFSLIPPDDGSHVIADFLPTQEKEGSDIVYRGPGGDWIEPASGGIVLKSLKMPPIFFKRQE